MLNVVKMTTRLLNISEDICIIWDKLAELSYNNLEESDEFNECVKQIEDSLHQETIILNTLNKETLEEILKQLFNLQRTDIAFERCYSTVDAFLDEVYIREGTQEDESEENDNDDMRDESQNDSENGECDEFDEADEETLQEGLYPLSYFYEDEEDSALYRKQIFHRVSITAIKKMLVRLNEVTADNKIDAKYKKRLIKYYKMFKYFFFSLDRDLEQLGVDTHFNIENVKDIAPAEGDFQAIYYNECINLLDNIYTVDDKTRELSDISETLFNMLCLDEYIDKLDKEHLEKLLTVCQEFEKYAGKTFYGNIGTDKITKKKMMYN